MVLAKYLNLYTDSNVPAERAGRKTPKKLEAKKCFHDKKCILCANETKHAKRGSL